MRCSPDSAMKRLPRVRPTSVSPTCRARSTPQAVNPERDTSIGIPIRTVLITISEVSRPVVYKILSAGSTLWRRSEEHTSELQSRFDLVCRLLLETKKLATQNV